MCDSSMLYKKDFSCVYEFEEVTKKPKVVETNRGELQPYLFSGDFQLPWKRNTDPHERWHT